jgi:hypothetical protein
VVTKHKITVITAVLVLLGSLLAASITQGQTGGEEGEVVWNTFDGGKYTITDARILIILPNKPLLNDRLGTYGNIIMDKGQQVFNTKDKELVTEFGLELYENLMRLKTDGWFAFRSAVLEYQRILIIPYQRTEWEGANGYLEQVLKLFAP